MLSYTQLLFANWAGYGRYGMVRVYIDGDCDYLPVGGSVYYSIPFIANQLAMVSVIIHVFRGCSGVLHIFDADNEALIASVPMTFGPGIYAIGIHIGAVNV